MTKAKFLSLLSALLFAVSCASASTTYDYTGNPFTSQTGVLAGQFTQINIALIFDQPLAPSTAYGSMPGLNAGTMLDWRMGDGLFDFSPATYGTLGTWLLQTDASGNIDYWLVEAQYNLSDGTLLQDISALAADGAGAYYPVPPSSIASVIGAPGLWSVAPAVPEPGSFALVLSALAAAAIMRRRKARG